MWFRPPAKSLLFPVTIILSGGSNAGTGGCRPWLASGFCYRTTILASSKTRTRAGYPHFFFFHSGTSGTSTTTVSTTRMMMMDFKDYLVSQKDVVQPNHVVVGNQAGDADSIISALTLAYIDSTLGGKSKTPIVSITQKDLETQRPEVSFLFRTIDLDIIDSMRFIDDPVVVGSTSSEEKFLTLVDHNRAEDAFSSNNNNNNWQVVEIVDHHFDEQQHLETCPKDGGISRQIAFENDKSTAASTCTLVAERLKALWKKPSSSTTTTTTPQEKYHSTLATLLLGTILLDSVNMIPAAGKGTPRDAAAIQDLLDNTDWSTSSKEALSLWFDDDDGDTSKPNTTKLFESLQAAKFDPNFWKDLAVQDALRLDYKSFTTAAGADGGSPTSTTFGASVILMPMQDFLKKDGVVQEIHQYMVQVAKVEFLAILFFATDDGGKRGRQLILCGVPNTPNGKLVEEVSQFLNEEGTLNLEEVVLDGVCAAAREEGDHMLLNMKLFMQRNVKASRKQVAPLLIQFFESQ